MRVWPRSAFLSNGIIRIEHHALVLYGIMTVPLFIHIFRNMYTSNWKDLTRYWILSVRRIHWDHLYHYFINQLNSTDTDVKSNPPHNVLCSNQIFQFTKWMNHLKSNLRETIRSKDRTAFIIIIIIICICLSFHMKFDNSISNSKLYNTVPAKIE